MNTKVKKIPDDAAKAVNRPEWARRFFMFVTLIFLLKTAHFLFTNPRFEWHVVGEFLSSSVVLDGLGVSILLTFFGMLFGSIIGTFLATMRLGKFKVGRFAAGNYFIYPRNVLDYVVLQGRRDRFNK